MPVTKQTIVEASIGILNRDGIEGLHMRALAKTLGIKAASLYWHIDGKQALYGEIAEYLCVHTAMPTDTSDPKRFLLEMSEAYRAMLLATRDSVPIFEDSVPNTPHRLAIIKAIMECLLALGLPGRHCLTASNLLNNYVLSYVADEARIRSRKPEEVASFAAMLGLGDNIVMVGQDFDEQFLYGLHVIFEGLDTLNSKWGC
jgi:AcrR family transcriptional regulator